MAELLYNPPLWLYAAFLLAGYPFGCIQSAYFVGRIFGKIDIRDHGSGNAGTTNVYRVMGLKPGLAVLFFDLLKTALPVFALNIALFGQPWGLYNEQYIPGLLLGLGIFIGHCFPFFLKFRGGKGVACTIGLLIMFDPIILGVVLSICLIIVLATRFISLASVTGFVSLGAVTTFYYRDYIEIITIVWVLSVIGLIQHRKNIKWLISGEEKRFNFRGGNKA
jgi:glycerol-3-phosphate acyltransferase PlsY